MNSALKPVLTASGPQNPPVSAQLNKPMHPQGTPTTYGQPSTHLSPSLISLPHNNPNVAHSHPNPAHQSSNHYSLNVPNAPQHYSSNSTSNNTSTIPASNHPVPNSSQAAAGGQTYSPSKNSSHPSGYQPNLGHPPNQNPLPPVSQTLPATQPPQSAPECANVEKPQSNGTPEVKSPAKPEAQENHHMAKEKSPDPALPPCDKSDEKSSLPALLEPNDEQKLEKQENVKVAEETKAALPTSEPATVPTIASAATSPAKNSENAPVAATSESLDAKSEDSESDDSKDADQSEAVVETVQVESSPKPKEKEPPQKTTPVAKAVLTPRTPTRKSKTPKQDSESPKTSKVESKSPSTQKSPGLVAKTKRTRTRTQPYQSPLPEIEIITKISSSTPRSKNNDEKLIVFYKNEFLAVRNSEGSFYICQAVQNIYKSSPKIRIRWLSQDKNEKSGEVYTPDFYDNTDFDCILTNLNLVRVDKGRYRLPPAEKERTDSILKRSLAVEKGEVTSPSLTEEHPDGIDLSLYKEESQLKKRKASKRKSSSSLRSGRKSTSNSAKSPDQAKVRKVVAEQPVKKPLAKRIATAKKPTNVETKKSGALSRMDRAKRRSDNQNHNKVSPVVDQKKARVLAKVARKTTNVNTANKSQPATKSAKVSRVTPSSSKVQKPPPKAVTRKTKRSSRK